MRRSTRIGVAAIVLGAALAVPKPGTAAGQDPIERFVRLSGPAQTAAPAASIEHPGRFSGYTNYWQTIAWSWRQHGNLFLIGQPDAERAVAQNKADIAEELGLPGLVLDEGFLDAWLRSRFPPVELEEPGKEALSRALEKRDALVWAAPSSPLGMRLLAKAPELPGARAAFGSHQSRAAGYRRIAAFVLADGKRRLFAVVAEDRGDRARLKELLGGVRDVVGRYDLHRGWFGTGTLLHSVTCHPGHPLEVIGQGLAQGNDWFTFSGYMDFLMRAQLPEWLRKVGLDDIAVDVGTGKATHSLGTVAYGLKSYDGLKIQDLPTEEEWIKFVKDRGGYIFRPVWAPECDKFKYDGQIAIDGNKKQIDTENVPFILQTGLIKDEAPACMVLFSEKGRHWSREEMWGAILERRAVGILPLGRMTGPARFRNALQMLLLDRIYLEDLYRDRVKLETSVEGTDLHVRLANMGGSPIDARVEYQPGPELVIETKWTDVVVPPGTERTVSFPLQPAKAAMGRANPLLVEARWPGGRKRALDVLDLPPAVSVHKLLYGQAPEVVFPVSCYDFFGLTDCPVEVKVFSKDRPATPVLAASLIGPARKGGHQAFEFRLPLRPGSYTVRTTALGATAETQLGVGEPAGQATVTPVDVDGDGLMEYRLENDKVRVTLLAIGARVIEYVVKEKNDNVLFKLWPEKEHSDRRPFRERGFYPYGGFEDFLGQASIETHRVYDAEVVKGGGTSATVRMRADYYGNRLEKIFTLDGASPLLEVRFALEFRNPELNMLGPQPILVLGEKHWTEDVFVIPARSGLREVRMRPEEYFGEVFFLKEGWNAGRDTVEDVSFVGAFPVSEPEFLHMWMNHPSNGESAHYYAEFQPWVPIFRKTVRYFSYYLWGAAGPWEKGLEELRRRSLITAAK
jgi:hypothetical protein